jgi:arylsulfatase A-like enzyme
VEDVDGALGTLLEGLDTLGLWEDLLVVVTSDHGEFFFEHGEMLHGPFWEPGIRVPLFVKWPGGGDGGSVADVPSSALDLAPTLLAAAGVPAEGFPGRRLEERVEARTRREPLFVESDGWAVVIRPGHDGATVWKLVHHLASGEVQLFDLAADPEELEDLAASHPDEARRLRELLQRERQRAEATRAAAEAQADETPSSTLTPEEERRLRSLGYL